MYNNMLKLVKIFWGILIFLIFWQGLFVFFKIPEFLLPSPILVGDVLVNKYSILFQDAKITGIEIILGMIFGSLLGIINGLLLQIFKSFRSVMLPMLVVSQAIPIYAIAPILVLWLGFDLAPKVVMSTIIIFFPVTTAFYDGLRQTKKGYLDIAKTMGANNITTLFKVRCRSALPALGSGLRVAAAFAPISAIVGEWVGASAGLGYRMLYSNARMQTDDMFGALVVLVVMSLFLYYFVDWLVRKTIHWDNDDLRKKC